MNRRTFVRGLLLAPLALNAIPDVKPAVVQASRSVRSIGSTAALVEIDPSIYCTMARPYDIACDRRTARMLGKAMADHSKQDRLDAIALNKFIASEILSRPT